MPPLHCYLRALWSECRRAKQAPRFLSFLPQTVLFTHCVFGRECERVGDKAPSSKMQNGFRSSVLCALVMPDQNARIGFVMLLNVPSLTLKAWRKILCFSFPSLVQEKSGSCGVAQICVFVHTNSLVGQSALNMDLAQHTRGLDCQGTECFIPD